jgi:hypothetical protein
LNGLNDWENTSLKLGGIYRSRIFQLWASGELPSITIGRLRFSTDQQIASYIECLEAGALA